MHKKIATPYTSVIQFFSVELANFHCMAVASFYAELHLFMCKTLPKMYTVMKNTELF